MEFTSWELRETNIVIAYDNIDLESISRDRLRIMLEGAERPLLAELPQGPIALFYQQAGIQCGIDTRRVRITDQGVMDIDRRPLGYMVEIAAQSRQILPGSNVMAYGFNYRVAARIQQVEDTGRYLRDAFLSEKWHSAEAIGGPIQSIGIQMQVAPTGEFEYNLNLQAADADASILLIGMNVHHGANEMPLAREMQAAMRERYLELQQLFREI